MDDKTIAATHYLEGDARSQEPVVSADGRFLVFTSRARNLVPGGRGNGAHVYVLCREPRKLMRFAVASFTSIPHTGSFAMLERSF